MFYLQYSKLNILYCAYILSKDRNLTFHLSLTETFECLNVAYMNGHAHARLTFQMLKFSLQLFPQLHLFHKLLLQFLCRPPQSKPNKKEFSCAGIHPSQQL